jgi:hypothetical protein
VNDSRPLLAANPGEILAVREQRVDESVRLMTSARVNDQTRWFIDYDQIVVLVQHIQRDLFRPSFDRFHGRLGDAHNIVAAHEIARTRGVSVERDETTPD